MPHHEFDNLGIEGLGVLLNELQAMHDHLLQAWHICPADFENLATRIEKLNKRIKVLIEEAEERISACLE